MMKRITVIGLCLVGSALISCSSPQLNFTEEPQLETDFVVDSTRSDPTRKTRPFGLEYKGGLIDTHVHLDPPAGGKTDPLELIKIAETITQTRVNRLILMPVPNEGHMRGRSDGAGYRIELKKSSGGKVSLFCGSQYISNWLHDAYHDGYTEQELTLVLEKLQADLSNPHCLGIGEIGLFHFNKTGHQHVIQYPPTFAPYLKIVELIESGGKWLDLHAEPVDHTGRSYEKQVFGALALFHQRFPRLKLIISHTGMTNSDNARKILQLYPNTMMNFKPIKKHHLWRNLEPVTDRKGRLYEDWAVLFEEMPERFMVGTDEKFGRFGKGALAAKGKKVERYQKSIRNIRRILGSIDPNSAKLIAYKNAMRLFHPADSL